MPSIEVSSVQPQTSKSRSGTIGHRRQGSRESNDLNATIKSMTRKTSKLSFGVRTSKDRAPSPSKQRDNEKDLPGRPAPTGLTPTPSTASSTFLNGTLKSPTGNEGNGGQNGLATPTQDKEVLAPDSPPPSQGKVLPPIPRDFAVAGTANTSLPGTPTQAPSTPTPGSPFPTGGGISHDAFESIGSNKLSVRFEINIVKVRFFFLPHYCKWTDSWMLLRIGTLATIVWHTVPASKRGRMAIPDARTARPYRAEVIVRAPSLASLLAYPESRS